MDLSSLVDFWLRVADGRNKRLHSDSTSSARKQH